MTARGLTIIAIAPFGIVVGPAGIAVRRDNAERSTRKAVGGR
jgi:hypothetical protein